MEQVQVQHAQINVQQVNIVLLEVQAVQIVHQINGQMQEHHLASQNVVV